MKILFVHEVSYEKKPIFEMHEFPEHLAHRGHDVNFLQFDEGFKFWSGQRQSREKIVRGRILPNTSIKVLTPHQFGIPGLDRLYAMISVVPVLDELLKTKKIDAIVLYAVPTYGRQVIRLAKKYRVPVIFRALDVSHLIRNSILSPLIKLSEKFVYRHATFLSANNPAMARYCSELGNRKAKTYVNLPPLDVSHFKPEPSESHKVQAELRSSLGIDAKDKVVAYLGTFFYFSGLDAVIREFAQVRAPGIKLLLIGGGEMDNELRRLVQELNLESQVKFTGFIPYAKLPAYLQLFTVAINPMYSRPVSNKAFPHKVLQYLAAEIPVVSSKLDGIFETFGSESGVTWVEGPTEVLSSALALAEDAPRLIASVKQQTEAVTRLLSLERAVSAFEAVIVEAVASSG